MSVKKDTLITAMICVKYVLKCVKNARLLQRTVLYVMVLQENKIHPNVSVFLMNLYITKIKKSVLRYYVIIHVKHVSDLIAITVNLAVRMKEPFKTINVFVNLAITWTKKSVQSVKIDARLAKAQIYVKLVCLDCQRLTTNANAL